MKNQQHFDTFEELLSALSANFSVEGVITHKDLVRTLLSNSFVTNISFDVLKHTFDIYLHKEGFHYQVFTQIMPRRAEKYHLFID